ncbi:MAG: peptidase S9 [Rhodothermales bacterium]|nr:peptidase S9 [Rhodothermales bacterium]
MNPDRQFPVRNSNTSIYYNRDRVVILAMIYESRTYRAFATALAVILGFSAQAVDAQYYEFGQNRVQYEQQDWKYIQTAHFDVFFYVDDSDLSTFTAQAAEHAYERVSDLFRHQIRKRIPILIYADPLDFGVTRIVDLPFVTEAVGGLTESFKNRIALPFSGNYSEFRNVLHHEIVHAVLNDMLYGGTVQSLLRSNFSMRLPAWFDEGLAEYAAIGWDSESDGYIRDAVLSGTLPQIPELSGYFAYKGGQSVWDYVASQYGHQKVAEILQLLKATRSIDFAFQQSTGLGIEDLSRQWHRALREIHFPEVAAREALESIARSVSIRSGEYHAAPEISPRGDRVAYIASDRGAFNVYVASTSSSAIPEKIASGTTTRLFESLRILSDGLSWNPTGEILAIATSSGQNEAIVLVDIRTGRRQKLVVPAVDYLRSIDWHPDGEKLAFEASADGRTNIFTVTVDGETVERVTDDALGAHSPIWSSDGSHIVFHSNRSDRHGRDLDLPTTLERSVSNLFRIDVGTGRIEQLTSHDSWNSRNASFGTDPNMIVFESDRNGVYNLYELNLSTGRERPVTNLIRDVQQSSISADGSRIVFASRMDGTIGLFVINAPFGKTLPIKELPPTLWAQRRDAGTSGLSVAARIASSGVEQSNPFIRDALDGVSFAESHNSPGLLAINDEGRPVSGSSGTIDPEAQVFPLINSTGDSSRAGVNVGFDTSAEPGFGSAEESQPANARLLPEAMAEDGSYKVHDYKLRFSPDLVYGTAGYDILYGVQGVTQMRVSDMIGHHRLLLTTNLLIDLRNSDYVLAYQYLSTRLDWEYSVFQVSRLLPDFASDRPTYFRFRQSGFKISASYPFDKFHRLDTDISFVRGSQADITAARVPSRTRSFIYPSITFTRDLTSGGPYSPTSGRRIAIGVAGSPAAIEGAQARFVTTIGDSRVYFSTSSGSITMALRLSAGVSTGKNPQLFYTSGVQNWINRGINDTNGFPIQNTTDFIFASPVLPARGFNVNERNGSNFVLTNVELRIPVADRPELPILNRLPVRSVAMTGFVDAGSLWGGAPQTRRLDIFGENASGERIFQDLLVGAGGGIRSLIFGFPARIDVAWPFDGIRFGQRHVYVSVGLDF